MDWLQVIANIAQVIGVIWVLVFGGKATIQVVRDFWKGRRRGTPSPSTVTNILLALILLAIVSSRFFPQSALPPTSTSTTPTPGTNVSTPSTVSTSTPTVGNTSSPTVTTSTSSQAPYGGTLVLNDPLRDNSKGYGWDETASHCTFQGEAYHVSNVMKNDAWECNTNTSTTDFRNFAYQVTMTIERGSQGGICFRFTANNQSGYCFLFDLNGHYVLETVLNEAQQIFVMGQSNYFVTGSGKSNQIAARVNGNTVDLFINSHLIKSVTDSRFSDGQIGMIIGTEAFADAAFTDAKVWVL